MDNQKLLLAENDVVLAGEVCRGLESAGYAAHWVADGIEAEETLRAGGYSVLLLSRELPQLPGLTLLTRMRKRGDDTPVMITAAGADVADCVEGLECGADDFLPKPFAMDELVARVRSLCRRGRHPAGGSVLAHGALSIDLEGYRVCRDGVPVRLSGHEFAILRTLLEHRGEVATRSGLEEVLYGADVGVESNTIEVHIHFLRKKLGSGLIKTVRGVGYMIAEAE